MVVEYGYYSSQWQKYEKGCSVTVDSLLKMASIFGIKLGELIDSLGDFPSIDPDTVARHPSQTKHSELSFKKKPTKKAAAKRAIKKATAPNGKGA